MSRTSVRFAHLEDDDDQASVMALWLADAGFTVDRFSIGRTLLDAAAGRHYDLFILDWLVPGMNGVEVVKRLRADGVRQPVLFLTQFDSPDNAATALEAGADDYLVKPAARGALLARIHALLRGRWDRPEDLSLGRYRTEAAERCVVVDGERFPLGPRQFEIARYLLAHQGRLVTRGELQLDLRRAAIDGDADGSRPLDEEVKAVVEGLGLDGRAGLRLVAVHRLGYRLEPVVV